MFDQSYGLRFDIYERIILAEDLPGIDELEEAELIPHIQVINQGEQATLRGHLLLAGLYKGGDGESEPLEHWIPVEITVPMNRVASLDEIAVEIENFDVDLLSARSLNITGVLSLKGIQAAAHAPAGPNWGEEEYTVVHAPPLREAGEGEPPESFANAEFTTPSYNADYETDGREADAPFTYPGLSAEPGEPFQQPYRTGEGEFSPYPAYPEHISNEHESSNRQQESYQPEQWSFERQEGERPVSGAEAAADPQAGNQGRKEYWPEQLSTPIAAQAEEYEPESFDSQEIRDAAEEIGHVQPPSQQEAQPAKPELKVALSAKNSTADAPGLGFSSLLHTPRSAAEPETGSLQAEQITPDEEPGAKRGDEVQWKSLFLGTRQEEKPFRKVRLCIVQREETLEAIAERYQLSPRELLLYNRLSEQSIEEGQILYIP